MNPANVEEHPLTVPEVEEQTPAGGAVASSPSVYGRAEPPVEESTADAEVETAATPVAVAAPVHAPAPKREKKAKAPTPKATLKPEAEPHPATTAAPLSDDDDEKPELVWYVLKVQSSREDTIRDALERRVKIQGLQRYFGRIVVPTEKTTEIRNNKTRRVERKNVPRLHHG